MDELERAAEAYRASRARLETEIRAARDRGESLRSIAAKVGWSYEQIRRLTG